MCAPLLPESLEFGPELATFGAAFRRGYKFGPHDAFLSGEQPSRGSIAAASFKGLTDAEGSYAKSTSDHRRPSASPCLSPNAVAADTSPASR